MEKLDSNSRGGYIGLLMLLIGVALISLFVVRTDLFKGKTETGEEGEAKQGESMIEQGYSAIDKAKGVKELMEERSRQEAEFTE